MHNSLKVELDLNADDIQAEYCITTRKCLPKEEWEYAHDFDAITLEPVGIRYQVWLDFKKPINLRPDSCSTYLWVKENTLLRKFLFANVEPSISQSVMRRITEKISNE